MTATTLPLPPTDGSHPNAQPVHYARPNAYANTSTAWQEDFRLLLRRVSSCPIIAWQVDKMITPEDSTFATRREFEDMLKAQEALHQSRKGAKKATVQNTVPLEKPGTLPRKSRAREYTPTGNPPGRPKGTAIKATKPGYQARPCPRCAVDFKPTNSVQIWCKACAKAGKQERRNEKRKEERGKSLVSCEKCGVVVPRTGGVQKYCNPCGLLERAEKAKARAAASRKALSLVKCLACGAETTAKLGSKRFCGATCYERWYKAQRRAEARGEAKP